MKYIRKFADSSREFGRVQSLAVCAMLLALRIVMGMFANFSLAFIQPPVIKVSLTFIPIMITAYLYGPVCAAVVAGAGDLLGYFMAPTALPYAPWITLCYIWEGIILGTVLYHEELTLPRAIVAKVLDLALCTLTLHSAVLWFLYFGSTPFYLVVLLRAAVLVPMAAVEVLMILAVKKPLNRIGKK